MDSEEPLVCSLLLLRSINSKYYETCDEETRAGPPDSKRPKVQWQETLIQLIAAQQQQIADLQQTKMVAPTPKVPKPEGHMPTSTHALFKVARYNPSSSAYMMEEWLDDVTKLKTELNVRVCPSGLIGKLRDEGPVSVNCWKTHAGHEQELRSKHLSRAEEKNGGKEAAVWGATEKNFRGFKKIGSAETKKIGGLNKARYHKFVEKMIQDPKTKKTR
ncbi:hypothetical protein NQ317_001785 [Molorchus minor]|uniref:Uncharacterized protein n=1 Tax=Molorchus minor TaxID=1323400 RepID=A0ABQ9JDL0_9CUCU|nr:hypothetical protein NQ317_001785 [Molorchus minor]